MISNDTVTVRAKVSFPSLVDEILYQGAPTGKYGLQLASLSGPAVEKLQELGITTKRKEADAYERGDFVDCKSSFKIHNEGRFNMLFEADGVTPFEGSPRDIGYGSIVRAKIKPYTSRAGTILPSLVALSVEELAVAENASGAKDEVVL